MPGYDRPYFENQRDRERSYRDRDRDFPSSRRGYRGREEDDDRGPWISRDRDEFERGFRGRDRRFEDFEEWERPAQMREREYSGHPSTGRSFRGRPYSYGPGGGYGAYGSYGSTGRYAGIGPKGYQRSDERLREEVCERLTADPDVDASELEVSVQNGEVTLQGTVPARDMKRAAEDCAEAISGVQQVHNRLRVEFNETGRDEGGARKFSTKGTEGQRSSAGRKAH
jgi:BON domain